MERHQIWCEFMEIEELRLVHLCHECSLAVKMHHEKSDRKY